MQTYKVQVVGGAGRAWGVQVEGEREAGGPVPMPPTPATVARKQPSPTFLPGPPAGLGLAWLDLGRTTPRGRGALGQLPPRARGGPSLEADAEGPTPPVGD